VDALYVFFGVLVPFVVLALLFGGTVARDVRQYFGVALLVAVGTVIYLGLTGHLND